MRRSHRAFILACTFGLALAGSSASAQTPHAHDHPDHPDVVFGAASFRPVRRPARIDSPGNGAAGQISTTVNNQILVELAPDDTTPANLFDLNGRTLVFTPDGNGGYSRAVRSVVWEDDVGPAVADGEEVQLQSFMFDFAGRRWGSFFVSRHGLITFGEPLTYSYWDAENRFDPMPEIARNFVTAPTISPLYKPILGGRSDRYGATQHVARSPDRVVVTWITTEPDFYAHGVPPEEPSRIQVVLSADGSIRFNYRGVLLGDGIVGLFPHEDDVEKSGLIASVADPRNPELPGHLDLLDAAIYASNTDAVILEFTLRGSVPDPPDGEWYSYRLHFDVDEPYWTHPVDWSDEDFTWQVDVRTGGERVARGQGVKQLLSGGAADRIALLADIGAFGSGISGTAFAATAHFRGSSWIQGDDSRMALVKLNAGTPPTTDLSRSDGNSSSRQSEVFHYRGVPDAESIACRVIAELGDTFDLFVFHNQFRVDSQESATPWTGRDDVRGIGMEHLNRSTPCGEGRLKGHWTQPVWMKSDHVVNYSRYHDEGTRFDRGLLLFAHELTHAWTAHLSYLRDGSREPLFGVYCQCHWREDLHIPAAFPWHADEPGPHSLMGGRYWRDNGDGTFTPLDGYFGGGHSWLDLYAMGLAEAHEVPDTFILRNLRPVNGRDPWGPHTGDREIVSIEQVVAAEGARIPSARDARKDFNAAFVYLLEPGQTPDPDMLRLHAEYRDKVIEHWSHVTGGRSRMTTTVPGVPNRSPAAVGTLPDLTLRVNGTPAVVDVAGAFRDPDGDPLTYRAASSAPAVATAVVAGSRATLTPVSVGMTTVTVTATDTGGLSAMQQFAVTVAAPSTFTDHPIRPGTTPIRAVHFRELRERIAGLRTRWGLPAVGWTDPILTAGVTPVRLVHLLELRSALAEAYAQAGRAAPRWSDTAPAAGTTLIRAVHLMELRAAVVELE